MNQLGIVFENVKYTDRKLNENIKVKIRMNIDNVPETNLLRPWYRIIIIIIYEIIYLLIMILMII